MRFVGVLFVCAILETGCALQVNTEAELSSADSIAYCSTTAAKTASLFAGGSGTSSSPYLICTAAQLSSIGDNYLTSNFKLMSDIDMTGITWSVIGSMTGAVTYSGTFDGNSHTISNLTVSGNGYQGLFGKITSPGVVQNLKLANISVTNTGFYTGGIAGMINTATISGCSVESGTVTGTGSVGGLVGYAAGTSAAAMGSIQSSYSKADVNGSASAVGGLLGYLHNNSQVTSSYATGTVNSSSNSTGGLIGNQFGTNTVTSSHATGSVTGADYVGGLIGMINGGITVNQSYATGNVTSSSAGATIGAGGFIGYYNGTSDVYDSYATGNVTVVSNAAYAGGFFAVVGAGTTTVNNSYALGLVTGTQKKGFQGAVGGGQTTSHCFWDVTTSGTAVADPGGASGISDTNMKTATTFTGASWSTSTWTLVDGSYPSLK